MLSWRQRGALSNISHRRHPPPIQDVPVIPEPQPRVKRGLSYSSSTRGTASASYLINEQAAAAATRASNAASYSGTARNGLSYSRSGRRASDERGCMSYRSPAREQASPDMLKRTATSPVPSAPPVEAKRSSTRRRHKLRRHSVSPVRNSTILRRMLRRQPTYQQQPRKRDSMRRFLRRRSASPIPTFMRNRRRNSNSPVSQRRRCRSHSPLLRRLRRTRLTLIRAANAHPVYRIMRSHPLTKSYIEESAPGITRETRANTERNAAAPPRGTRKPYKRKAPPKIVSRAELRFKKELMFADEGSLCGDGRREHIPIHFGSRDHRPRRITAPPPPPPPILQYRFSNE